MTTVKDFKEGATLDNPIYAHNQYVVTGKEGCIVVSGCADKMKNVSSYYDDCEIDIRRHDLHMNDNSFVGEIVPKGRSIFHYQIEGGEWNRGYFSSLSSLTNFIKETFGNVSYATRG
jgi:hypothetical protein